MKPGSIVRLKQAVDDVFLYGIVLGHSHSNDRLYVAVFSPAGAIRLDGSGMPIPEELRPDQMTLVFGPEEEVM